MRTYLLQVSFKIVSYTQSMNYSSAEPSAPTELLFRFVFFMNNTVQVEVEFTSVVRHCHMIG